MGSSPSPLLEVPPTAGAWVPSGALTQSPPRPEGLLDGGLTALGCFLPLNWSDLVTIG